MGYSIAAKIALVTGANRGIGESMVDALVAAGAGKVYAAARRIDDLAPILARHGARVVALRLDVTDPAQIREAVAAAPDVQLLVNNAGVAGYGGGAFANIGSLASLVSFPLFIAYSASKAATHSITQAARAMLKAQGTQVFGVYPGPIDTRLAEAVPFQKTSPADAARAIVAGIQAGTEDIFPDPMSQAMGAAFFADPKAVERQTASMVV